MKRIKQELLEKGFIVHTKTKEQMENVIEFLETVDSIGRNTNPEFWKYYQANTILDINNYTDGKVYYGNKLSEEEYIYEYDDIWEHCGGVVESDNLWEFENQITILPRQNGKSLMSTERLKKSLEKDRIIRYKAGKQCDHFIDNLYYKRVDTITFENGSVLRNTPANISSVRGVSAENIEKFKREYSCIFTGGNKMKYWELRCNEISDNVDIDFTKGKIYKLTKEGLETDSCLFKDFLDGDGITPYDKWRKYIRWVTKAYKATIDFSLVGNVERMKEMNKIEIKIEKLKNSIINNQLKLEELETANKHANLSSKISSTKLLMDEEIELLKGYQILDGMRIGNIIINNNTVIVISSYGAKAISKLSEGDDFNILAGIFLCLVKLGSEVNTDFYDYSIHAALEDIELGNL